VHYPFFGLKNNAINKNARINNSKTFSEESGKNQPGLTNKSTIFKNHLTANKKNAPPISKNLLDLLLK